MFFNWCCYFYCVYTLLCLTKCRCEERTIKHNDWVYVKYLTINLKNKIMENIEKIKLEAFIEFLKRLGQHKLGECMDIIPHNVDYENIKIPNKNNITYNVR